MYQVTIYSPGVRPENRTVEGNTTFLDLLRSAGKSTTDISLSFNGNPVELNSPITSNGTLSISPSKIKGN